MKSGPREPAVCVSRGTLRDAEMRTGGKLVRKLLVMGWGCREEGRQLFECLHEKGEDSGVWVNSGNYLDHGESCLCAAEDLNH